jgi:hypothetical protein
MYVLGYFSNIENTVPVLVLMASFALRACESVKCLFLCQPWNKPPPRPSSFALYLLPLWYTDNMHHRDGLMEREYGVDTVMYCAAVTDLQYGRNAAEATGCCSFAAQLPSPRLVT